ncbi:hypothetical protein SLA2020_381040 [Shorea laevis]
MFCFVWCRGPRLKPIFRLLLYLCGPPAGKSGPISGYPVEPCSISLPSLLLFSVVYIYYSNRGHVSFRLSGPLLSFVFLAPFVPTTNLQGVCAPASSTTYEVLPFKSRPASLISRVYSPLRFVTVLCVVSVVVVLVTQ